jgi:hypothetical protein
MTTGGRMPTSARRYTETSRLRTANNAARLTNDIYADVEYNPVPKRGGNTYVQDTPSLPRPRPNTTQDRAIRTGVNPLKPALQPTLPRRAMSRRALIFGGVGTFFFGIVGGNVAINTINQWRLEMAQGVNPARSLDIVCGHGDSPAHPTQLHVFIQDHQVNFIEYPGGVKSRSRGFTGEGLPKTGDVSAWDLEITPQQVDGGRYQILITVQGSGFVYRWLLVDSGSGYFRGVNPK